MVTLISDHAKQEAPAQADEDRCYWRIILLQVWDGEQGWPWGGHFLRKGFSSGSLSLISSPTAKWSKTSTDDFHITEIVTPGQMFPERERFMISYFIFCHSLSPHFGSSRTEASWRAWKRALHTAQLPQCHCLPGIPWARGFPPSPHVIFYPVGKWKVLN